LLPSRLLYYPPTSQATHYTLSLHDALPISRLAIGPVPSPWLIRFLQKAHNSNPPDFIPRARPDAISRQRLIASGLALGIKSGGRSEEHTSELQSREKLVCRLLLEKKILAN